MTSPSPPRLVGLVLAAGASRRFGSPKQLALIDGVPMLQRVIETAQAALPPDESGGEPRSRITVVLGAHAEAVQAGVIERLAPPRPHVVFCPDWESGQAHSLRCGLAALRKHKADAALVLLGDTPYVSHEDLLKLIAAWARRPSRPAVAAYGGTNGAPCIFPKNQWPLLERLTGDRGAAPIIRLMIENGQKIESVALQNSLYDIDTKTQATPKTIEQHKDD